jgi:hypothetical protein
LAITETVIENYQTERQRSGVSNRTVNMDVGVLRRILKRCARWQPLESQLQFLSESASKIGQALTRRARARAVVEFGSIERGVAAPLPRGGIGAEHNDAPCRSHTPASM